MLFVGDDWAEDHHDVEIEDEAGQRLVRKRLPEGLQGISLLPASLSGHRSKINGNAHRRRLPFRPRTLPSPFSRRQRLAGAATCRFRGSSRSVARCAGRGLRGPRRTADSEWPCSEHRHLQYAVVLGHLASVVRTRR